MATTANGIDEQPPHNYDEDAKRTIAQMKDICIHYSKQNISIKTDYTFEDIKEEQGLLNMNKVIAFLQDFDIQVHPKVSHNYSINNF